MSGNQTQGVLYDRARHRREFDALTPGLRRIMSAAPYDYTTAFVLKEFKRAGEAEARAMFVRRVFLDRDALLRSDWPPGHPMIGQRTPERRAGR